MKGNILQGDKDISIQPCPVDKEFLPEHIAIIMDGNGRWAKERGLRRTKGHEEGADRVSSIVEHCSDWGVKVLTLYAFSSENWNRSTLEINALMLLLGKYLKKERDYLCRKNVKFRAIGDIDRLPSSARKELDLTFEATEHNTGLVFQLALSYGGRDEVVRAVRIIAEKCKDGSIEPKDIDEDTISGNLDTAGLPDPDLMIRTAGEMRLSNFLLWQASYAEYYCTDICWPDFDSSQLAKAVIDFSKRTRKYGGVVE
ncbi:MAG: isoprenyl transferase [Planctomycetota bacterium]|jgi:undecaprenyl diphosphate synthase